MDEQLRLMPVEPTTEVEMSVLEANSHLHVRTIKDAMEENGFKFKTDTVMDVNYTYGQGKTYRITIHREIDETLEPFRRNMSFKVFQGLSKNHRVINKVRQYVSDIAKPKIRLRVSSETVVPYGQVKDIVLTRSDDKKIAFRLKTRSSAIVKDTPDYSVRVDLTLVSTAPKFLQAMDAASTHEVEVELVFKRSFERIPAQALNDLQETARMINDLVTAPVPTRSVPVATETTKKDPNIEVQASDWMLPNRVGFVEWMYKTFKYEGERATNNVSLFDSQRLVRDYLQIDSPYRGLLLYHGLGVGKSCASIAAAEGFLQNHHKVIVMLPASLVPNYRREIMKCSSVGNPAIKMWNAILVPDDEDARTDVIKILKKEFGIGAAVLRKMKGRVWVPRVPDAIPAALVKTKNIAWANLNNDDKQAIAHFMDAFIDHKFEFISFNGINEKKVDVLGSRFFDDAFVIMDEAHNFISRFVNNAKVAQKLYQKMMDARNMKLVLLSGTPVINHPYEIAAMLNLVRGRMTVYEFSFTKQQTPLPSRDQVLESLTEAELLRFVDTLDIKLEEEKLHITLLPYGYVHGDGVDGTVVKAKWPRILSDTVETLHKHLINSFKVAKNVREIEQYALPTSKALFQELYLDETDRDNPRIKNADIFMRRIMGIVSYFRTAGAEYFPSVLPRVVRKIPMSSFQFARYIDIRTKERRMEGRKGAPTGLMQAKGTVYRAFSRMACNFTFPDEIKRPFPKDLRKELEKEISQDEEDAANADEGSTSKTDAAKTAVKTYDVRLQAALESLKEGAKEYLAAAKLQDLYSPKFAAMLTDINESPGSCLMYSQFRTVEGLGIYRMVLEAAGFVEIEVEKKSGARGWAIVNAPKVLAPEYDNKRFVVFNEDREKTDLLMKLFNNQWTELPNTIQQQLREARASNNLYGTVAKVIMISQSGAEGISLRNVRRVIITEPFWNMVRIDQVIGRAIRTKSHEELPLQDRNVQVFVYMATFTPKQLKQDFTLQRLDHSQSSDEHIMAIAEQKDSITRAFLDMMKRAAIDCLVHASKNKTTSFGMQCYAFPVNMDPADLAFEPSVQDDIKQLFKQKFIRKKKIQGKVVISNGKKFVFVDGRDGLFDYNAYKEAGVLVRV